MEENQPMKKVKYRNRPGFETRGTRWLYRLLYPFFHCKVDIPDTLQNRTEPIVFVANHYSIFGPVSYVISMPVMSNIWINEALVNEESATQTLRLEVEKKASFLGEKTKDRISRKLGKMVVNLLSRFGVIPVDRTQPSKLFATMRKSLQSLEKGYNLMIFPEIGLPTYSLTSVTPFYSGFATLGELYYRKTGKILQFCPCYIDEQHHQIRLGELVSYMPDAEDIKGETERVSEDLNLQIRQMAAENRGLQKKKSTRKRQSVLALCNLARFALLIPLITMMGFSNTKMILLLFLISQVLRIIFGVACSTYSSTNSISFLFAQGADILTAIFMLSYLAAMMPQLRVLLYMQILNGMLILISNLWTFARHHRCAGVNYFDSLSANLLCVFFLQQMLRFPLNGLVQKILGLAVIGFLICSTCLAVTLNFRIASEE